MVNPLRHTNNTVRSLFTSADECDYFDHTILKVGAVVITPIVAPVAFVAAFFKKAT